MRRFALWSSLSAGVLAQSSVASSCVKRSIVLYTSGTSTYVVTDLGTTSFEASASFCANASTSTVHDTITLTIYGPTLTSAVPASTVTVYQPNENGNQTITDTGFEGGSETPFNSTSIGDVTAEVATTGPLPPYAGDSYLLITFGASSTAPVRRQAFSQPAYNVTQVFSATAGTSYTLSAFAAIAANGNSVPSCSLTICAEGDCSSPSALTASYAAYSYTYNARVTDPNAVATFTVSCSGAAYVAVDNVSVLANTLPSPAGTVTATVTQYVTQSQAPQTQLVPITTTQVFTTTAFISGSNILVTTTIPTVIWSTVTQPAQTQLVPYTTTQVLTTTTFISGSNVILTTTVPAVLWSTVVQISTQPAQTQLVPITTTEILTTTALISGSNVILTTAIPTVIWSTLIQTVSQPAVTQYQTLTQIVPITTSTTLRSTVTINGEPITITTAVPTILYSTIRDIVTQPAVTQYQTATQVVQITTSQVVERTATINGSPIIITTAVPTIIYSTVQQIVTQPASTQYQTVTQVVQITTSQVIERTATINGSPVIVTTAVPTVIYSTIQEIVTQPAVTQYQTVTQVSQITTSRIVERTTTISGSPVVITTAVPTVIFSTIENIRTQLVTQNFTLPQATYTPAAETTYITRTLPAPTITNIVSVTPPALNITRTLPQVTEIQTLTPAVQIFNITRTLPQPTQYLNVTQTLPAETFTPPAATLTLSPGTITQTATTTKSCSNFLANSANGALYCTQTGEWIIPYGSGTITTASTPNVAACAFRCTGTCQYFGHYVYGRAGAAIQYQCFWGTSFGLSSTSMVPPTDFVAGTLLGSIPTQNAVTQTPSAVTFTQPPSTATATLTLAPQTTTVTQTNTATATAAGACGVFLVNTANRNLHCTTNNAYIYPATLSYTSTTGISNAAACAYRCTGGCQYWLHWNPYWYYGSSANTGSGTFQCYWGTGVQYSETGVENNIGIVGGTFIGTAAANNYPFRTATREAWAPGTETDEVFYATY